MRLRLPNCAWCGETLRFRLPRSLLDYPDLPGTPMIGIHMKDCIERDSCFLSFYRALPDVEPRPAKMIVDFVEARGPGRVVRGVVHV